MKHLTSEQRYALKLMLEKGMTQKEIASSLKVHKSTVSRELGRNCDMRSGVYKADLAQRKAEKRKSEKRRKVVFTQELKDSVKDLLEEKFSPEQIVGRMRLENNFMVSIETIYQMIWKDKHQGGILHTHLRHQGRKYQKRGNKNAGRGCIPNRVDIEQRPGEVELKKRAGDLEIDTIIGKDHKGAILTINDRVQKIVYIRKLEGKDADQLADKVIEVLSPLKGQIHTITADNGKEFAKHERIAQELGIKFYFCKPYHSWERGANENTNGLIRQYIPKKTNFDRISHEYVKWIEEQLNNRPRKTLGYLTPIEKKDDMISSNRVAFVS